MSAGSQISHLKIEIESAGMRWTVRDKASSVGFGGLFELGLTIIGKAVGGAVAVPD
jgi:hypothetical protein